MHPAILRLVNSVLGEQQLKENAVEIGGHKGKGDSSKGASSRHQSAFACDSWVFFPYRLLVIHGS